jgi:inosine-uridine nucleoside N-ribohydrolase
MKSYTITTDPGIDDLVALLLLAKLTPGAHHCLVSSFGNAPINVIGRNAREFISFAAPQWSYYEGASTPLCGKVEHPWPDYFHGPDAVWGVHPKIARGKVKPISFYPSNDTLISLCPMTEAYNLLKDGKLKEAIIMGGAMTISGNETLHAETNIAFDPDAAANFFATCNGIDVKLVPLDVTRKVFWSIKMVKNIPETSDQSVWIKQMLLAWFKNYNHDKEKDFNLHDPLTVYLAFFPEKAIWKKSGIKVITEGKMRGKTQFDGNNTPCEIAMELIDPTEIATNIFRLLFT